MKQFTTSTSKVLGSKLFAEANKYSKKIEFRKLAKNFNPETMEKEVLEPNEVKISPAIELGAKLFGYFYDKVLNDPSYSELEPEVKVRTAYNLADEKVKEFVLQKNMNFEEEEFNSNISKAQYIRRDIEGNSF